MAKLLSARCVGSRLQPLNEFQTKYEPFNSVRFHFKNTVRDTGKEAQSSVGGNHAAGFSISHCLPHLPSALISHRLMPKSGRVPVEMIIAQCARATAFPKPKSLPD